MRFSKFGRGNAYTSVLSGSTFNPWATADLVSLQAKWTGLGTRLTSRTATSCEKSSVWLGWLMMITLASETFILMMVTVWLG